MRTIASRYFISVDLTEYERRVAKEADHVAVVEQDGNGQFELNWEYDDCLATADKHTFFKFMAKSVAEKHGEQRDDELQVG